MRRLCYLRRAVEGRFGTAGFCGFSGTDLLAVRNATRFEIRACELAARRVRNVAEQDSGARFDDTHHVMREYSGCLYDKIKDLFCARKIRVFGILFHAA
jgi:hypothetical protein